MVRKILHAFGRHEWQHWTTRQRTNGKVGGQPTVPERGCRRCGKVQRRYRQAATNGWLPGHANLTPWSRDECYLYVWEEYKR